MFWRPRRSQPFCDRGTSWCARPRSCRRARSPRAARRCRGTRCRAWSPGRGWASTQSYTSTPEGPPRRCRPVPRWRSPSHPRWARCRTCSVSWRASRKGWGRISAWADDCYRKFCALLRSLGNIVGDHWSYIHHCCRCNCLRRSCHSTWYWQCWAQHSLKFGVALILYEPLYTALQEGSSGTEMYRIIIHPIYVSDGTLGIRANTIKGTLC